MKISSAASPAKGRLAERIRRARRYARLTQTDLAARLGVTSSAVAQWEHLGGTCPEVLRLEAIAGATSVNIEWLATGRGRQTGRREHHAEPDTLKLDFFAQDSAEESLQQHFRALPPRGRQLLSDFLEELAHHRRWRPATAHEGAASDVSEAEEVADPMKQR